jgi:DNA-binding transcriptional MerR regulator
MDKSPEAFRTISEVAESLETPAHVLRFWESRFPQIRPVKRAGGRRYYRPADVALLTGIKRLLHEEGLTIRGVQKILREQGVRHVAALAGAPEADLAPYDPAMALEEAMAEQFVAEQFVAEQFGAERIAADPEAREKIAEVETAQIYALESALRRPASTKKPGPPDLFDLLDEKKPLALEPLALEPLAPELLAPEPKIVADERQATEATHAISRAALLRALPYPLPDDLRAALAPMRNQIALHRDRLIGAGRDSGHRG